MFIKNTLAERGRVAQKIVLFCDRWHAMRLRVIWKHFFPVAEIEIRASRYVVGSDYAQKLLRSPITFWLANTAGLIAMKVCGVEVLDSIKQP